MFNSIFRVGTELVGDLGWKIVKNSGRAIYGSGQAIIGIVTEDDELVENGVKNLGQGAFGLSVGLVKKAIAGDNSEEDNQDIDLDSM
jgi:hypothetical protein